MMLFDPVENDAVADHGKSVVQQGLDIAADGRRLKDFKSLLGEIFPGSNVHFYSGGNWSLHELVSFLFTVTGPADLFFSTWALREEPVRSLLLLKDAGIATSISCLLDSRSTQRDNNSVLLAQSNFNKVGFTRCHAKVTVLRNDMWGIAINGSQNYTKNPRIECGVISCDKSIADFHVNWMRNELHD